MELEDLKLKWQSVKPHIELNLNDEVMRQSILKGNDAKSRLLKRYLWGQVFASVCLILLATSRIWAPMKFPYWWLSLACALILSTIIWSVCISNLIKKINFWEDSNTKIMVSVLSIKKQYRNMELISGILTLPLLLWISSIPPFINTWRMFFVWGITLLAFVLEYLWYNSNMKQINNLINWEKE
ncbi:MAG: hypothetical protein K2J78_07110 [Muribaculaceae bacterium]|nr:hypothetical protein [Muribaculaceae bacterium]